MRVSQEWLGDFVDLEGLTPGRIADLLTLSGTEVERILDFGAGLDQVVVAEVAELARLADSDHLWMTKVRVPGEEPVDVVCGAQNLTPGAVVAWARQGTELPGGMRLGQRRIRGALSNGMICAPDELGLGTEHDGVLILPEGEAELGAPLSRIFPLDTVYELEILSHRGDCLSHWGVARELAAVADRRLRPPELGEPERSGPPASQSVAVQVESAADCPVYLAECVDQLAAGASPLWLQRRLMAVGARSISAVVDLANYVMLDLGQPVHTFDLDRLGGASEALPITVRRGRAGESLACLDGERRPVQGALVIAVEDQVVALAGIIGGSATAVQSGTTRIVLEAASFDWVSIRQTSRRLGLRTEASSRFERALAPALAPLGARRFVHLVGQLAGGRVRPGPVRAGDVPAQPPTIRVSAARISALLGLPVGPQEAAGVLRRLEFEVSESGEDLTVVPPPVRTDVRIQEDVIEEVGRVLGYERLPATLPGAGSTPSGHPGLVSAERLAGEICLGAGFTEAITSSLTGSGNGAGLALLSGVRSALRIENPLSSQLGELRLSCLPALLEACQLNQARGSERTRLFEWGRVFWPGDGGDGRPEEPEMLALVDHSWGALAELPERALDRLMQVAQALGDRVSGQDVQFRPGTRPGFAPDRSAEVWVGAECRGVLGEVDPGALPELELRGTTAVLELRVDGWLLDGGRPGRGVRLAKTPALSVDLAVAVPEEARLGAALIAVRGLDITELEEIRLTDQYRGPQLDPETKGWTFRLVFRHPEKTLTHREGEQLRTRVLAGLERVGATLRRGSA